MPAEPQNSFMDAMDNFKLSSESLAKIGLNEDHTDKEDYVAPDKLDYDARVTQLIPQKESENTEKSEETEKKEPEKKEEPEKKTEPEISKEEKTEPEKDKKEDKPESQPETTNVHPKLTEALKQFDTPEKQEKLATDLENRDKWWSSLTQKAQLIAEDRKKVDDLIETLCVDEIKSALDDPELQKALDDWYEEKGESNPFKKMPDIKKQAELREKQAAENFDKDLERQITTLIGIDKKYENPDEQIKLARIADEKGVNLLIAHELQKSNLTVNAEINTLTSKVSEKEKVIADKDKEIERLTKELKDRNLELTKIRENGTAEVKPGANGQPLKAKAVNIKATNFDDVTSALHKMAGE